MPREEILKNLEDKNKNKYKELKGDLMTVFFILLIIIVITSSFFGIFYFFYNFSTIFLNS